MLKALLRLRAGQHGERQMRGHRQHVATHQDPFNHVAVQCLRVAAVQFVQRAKSIVDR